MAYRGIPWHTAAYRADVRTRVGVPRVTMVAHTWEVDMVRAQAKFLGAQRARAVVVRPFLEPELQILVQCLCELIRVFNAELRDCNPEIQAGRS